MTESQNNLAKFCPGCGHPIVLTMIYRILKEKRLEAKTVLGLDIGCSLLAWNYLPINTFQTHHGRVVPTMVGFKRARKEAICLAYVGDGGAYAIGWQSLFHAARRDEPVFVIVVNNTLYGMTGGQTAPTSLSGQITPTSPNGYTETNVKGPELLRSIASSDAFLARSAVNEPKQMMEYVSKAIETQAAGHFALVEFLSFCPTNWRTNGIDTINHLNSLKSVYKTGIV